MNMILAEDVTRLSEESGLFPVRELGDSASACDALEDDRVSDPVVFTTKRRLLRLATIAASTGARFEREGADLDPVEWLLTPQALFGGRSAFDACGERDHLARAVLVNELSLSTDVTPDVLDGFIVDENAAEAVGGRAGSVPSSPGVGARLTSFLDGFLEASGCRLQAFRATSAANTPTFRLRFERRQGDKLAEIDDATDDSGTSHPTAEALVPSGVRFNLARNSVAAA